MTINIEVMGDLEHVRARHTMYTDGVDHATKEAIDNVIDEFQAEACTYLGVALDTKLNQVIIADNGRGIPTDIHETEKLSKLAVVFTKLHSSGKYKNRELNNYSTTIGLNGVGVKITSATSEIFEAWTTKKNKVFKVTVERGVLKETSDGSGIVKDKLPTLPLQQKVISTVLRYTPDPTVYGAKYCRVSADYLKELCASLQYLCPSLSIELVIDGERSLYASTRGIIGLLEPKGADIECKKFMLNKDALDLVLWWNEGAEGETILSFVNCQKTKDGGTHVNALRSSVTEAFGEAGKSVSSYLREGLRCAFHLKIADPQFQGQNKHRLLNPEASDIISKNVTRNLELFLAENPKLKETILQRALALKKAHESYKKDRDAIKNLNKGKARSLSLPDKLISAPNCRPEQRELFVCLHGDTKVVAFAWEKQKRSYRLVKGDSSRSIREMAKFPDRLYKGYSYGNDNLVLFTNPRKTGEMKRVIKLILEHDESAKSQNLEPPQSIRCTPEHKLLTIDGRWVEAKDSLGELLMNGQYLDAPIKVVKIRECKTKADVYCLTVPETKNFMLYNGMFVHNCEGASAAGPIIRARTRPLYQEVYMLKGKITNACRSEMGKTLANPDIIGLVQSIGCGILDDCDPKKARVGKVLLTHDADSDGAHLDALVTSFFMTYMPQMIEEGRIFRVKSPLYMASYRDQHWYGSGLSDATALADVMSKIPDNLKSKLGKSDGITITRFKGHGAASSEAIRDYALGSNRELEVIRLPLGDSDLVSNLMGDDVAARKELLGIDW
jgi:DNA gyrase/topoisomerase IV subunit B